MSSSVSGGVRLLLRLEGLCIFVASLMAYEHSGNSWVTFVLFFFAPDLSFLGYLAGPKIGAIVYNAAHSFIGAVALIAIGFFLTIPVAVIAGIIWVAHIGFDRAFGYGLKYLSGFQFTHLGIIGRNLTNG